MNTNYLSKRLLFFAITLVFLGIGLACLFYIFSDTSNSYQAPVYTYYTFDPDTVLSSLAGENQNVFIVQDEDFEPVSSEPVNIVKWSQGDYLRITDAVHEQFWQTTIENWKIHFMTFRADCEHIAEGPQQGIFRYYESTNRFFGRSGLDETIYIDPSTKSVSLSYEGLSSRSQYSRSIDLSELKISVHTAFQIAENNGGREVRLRVNNDCFVGAVLSPYEINMGWNVYYYNKDSPNIFEINIDEFNGEYEVIRP